MAKITKSPILVFAKDEDGWTPLHWAARWGHTEVAQALLEAGADVNAKNELGQTPLDMAAEEGEIDMILLLAKAAQAQAQAEAQAAATPYKQERRAPERPGS